MLARAIAVDLFSGTIDGWDVAFAVVSVAVGWIASVFAKRGATALVARLRGISPDVAALLPRLARYLILLVAVGIALTFLGASVQPLLAAAIIVGVILALALRGVANNFAAGVVIQTRRSIKLGDEIECGGHIGSVRELNGRAVVIRTRDGRTIHIPNLDLLQSPVVNHSEAGARRSEVEVRVDAAGADLDHVAESLEAVVRGVDGVHKREAAEVLMRAASARRVTYRVRFWHHPAHGPIVTSRVVSAIAALDGSGVPALTVQSELPDPPLTPPDPV